MYVNTAGNISMEGTGNGFKKNGNAMFQRMMEWVLAELDNADPYVDDIIV